MMYTSTTFISLFIALFICSCRSGKSDSEKLSILNQGLINSNSTIHAQTFAEYKIFENKLSDPASKEKALVYNPKVIHIKILSDSIRNFIEDLKIKLHNEGDRENAVQLLFETNEKSFELYNHLKAYEDSILTLDVRLFEIFGDSIRAITRPFFSSVNKDLNNSLFHNTSTGMALALLSKFENDVDIAEKEIVTFFNNNISKDELNFDVFTVIIGQNTNYTRAGKLMEINAGVGAFTKNCEPKIKIDDIDIPLTDGAVATYKFKAANKPGKHFVPVTIDYTDKLGKKNSQKYQIQYSVIK